MMQLHTYPINVKTRIARASTDSSAMSSSTVLSSLLKDSLPKGLSRMSSMRAALNSQYCMRAQLRARSLVNEQPNEQSNDEYFSYQEGQHRVISNGKRQVNGNGKLHLPEEVKITKTKNGKHWTTSSMEVELAKDVLEVRDGLGKVIDSMVL